MTDDGIANPHIRRTAHVFWVSLVIVATATFVAPSSAHAHLIGDSDAEPPDGVMSSLMTYEFFGFQIPEEAFPVGVVFVGDPADGMDHDGVDDAIRRAISAWNDVPCSYARLEWAGRRDAIDDVADDEIAVQFTDEFHEIPDTIARFTWPHPTPPLGIDVYLNTLSYQWTHEPQATPDFHHADRPTVVLSAALAHEFGHALGLDHTDAHNAATMAPHYLVDGSQAELSADDKLGLCELYPRRGYECFLDSHCPPSAPCIFSEHGHVCDIPLGEVGDYCSWQQQHCSDVCHIEHRATGTGFCTTACADDADCPPHFLCVEDANDGPHCRVDPDDPPPQSSCRTTQSPTSFLLIAMTALFSLAAIRRNPSALTTRWLQASP